LRDAVSAVAAGTAHDHYQKRPTFFTKDICIALAALKNGTRLPRLPKERLPEQGEAQIGPALKQ
jgi:hypothetical protein